MRPLRRAQAPPAPHAWTKASATATQPVPLPPPNPKTPPQLTPEDVTAFLDGFLPLQLQRDDVAGATISIYQNGQPLILKGYGYADFKKKTPVDPVVTTFRPGSISKLFTYVSMMQLVEQGKLNLDANVQQYLDFKINPGPGGIGDAPITLRNLATHTAGFEEEVHDFGSDKSGELPIDLRNFLIRDQPNRYALPGKDLAYSNYGIALIGYIVQRVSGEPFAAYVQRHIFTPLGMTHSTFEQPLPKGFIATKGYLHTAKDDTGFEGVTEAPAGGLSSTAADMATFGQMLLGHGTYNGVQILQPASVALLLTPQFTPGPGVTPWDLGFYDADRNGVRFIGHGGDLIADATHAVLDRARARTLLLHQLQLSRNTHKVRLAGSCSTHSSTAICQGRRMRILRTSSSLQSNSRPTRVSSSARAGKTPQSSVSPGSSPRRSRRPKRATFKSPPRKTSTVIQSTFIRLEMIRSMTKSIRAPFTSNAMHMATSSATQLPATPTEAPLLTAGPMAEMFRFTMALVTMLLLVVIAALIRTWRRIFFFTSARSSHLTQAGTAWATFSMQLAGFALLALLVYIAVLASHVSEITTFYQIGHLDPWLRFEVALAALVFLTLIFAFLSGVRAVRRPLRWITRLKFTIVTLSCLYLGWFLLFFHLTSNPSRF